MRPLDLGLGMANFTDLNLFALEEVEGIFQIHKNGPDMQPTAPLETIELPVIQKIGSVHIEGCGKLTDFSAFLPVIGQLNADTWFVHEDCGYSPTYEDMKAGHASKQ